MLKSFFFAFDFVIDRAALMGVDVRSAELLLFDFAPKRAIDDGRAGDEELAGAFDHHREVRRGYAGGAKSGDRAE